MIFIKEEIRRVHEAMMEELRRICNDGICENRTLGIREVEGGRGIVSLLQFLFLLVLLCASTKAHMSPGKLLNQLHSAMFSILRTTIGRCPLMPQNI